MKLVTFQSMDALRALTGEGRLLCRRDHIHEKYAAVYAWVIARMGEAGMTAEEGRYPLWCWVKCRGGVCPPRHKGAPVPGYDVKITFHKREDEVFVTDYRRYSFLLNHTYIPESREDRAAFEGEMERYGISQDALREFIRGGTEDERPGMRILADRVRESYRRCVTRDSDILQGCVWEIALEDVEKIEFLREDGYTYGSLNYRRSGGKRMNWREDFYRRALR